jgi:hypothetical protein
MIEAQAFGSREINLRHFAGQEGHPRLPEIRLGEVSGGNRPS